MILFVATDAGDMSEEDLPLFTLAERQPSQAKSAAEASKPHTGTNASATDNAHDNAALTAPSSKTFRPAHDAPKAAASAACDQDGSPEPSVAAVPAIEPRTTRSRSKRMSTDASPSLTVAAAQSIPIKSEVKAPAAKPSSGRRRSITPAAATAAPSPAKATADNTSSAAATAATMQRQCVPETVGPAKKSTAPRRSSRLSATSVDGPVGLQQDADSSKRLPQPEATPTTQDTAVQGCGIAEQNTQPQDVDQASPSASAKSADVPMKVTDHDKNAASTDEASAAAPTEKSAARDGADAVQPADTAAEVEHQDPVIPAGQMSRPQQGVDALSTAGQPALQQADGSAQAATQLPQQLLTDTAPADVSHAASAQEHLDLPIDNAASGQARDIKAEDTVKQRTAEATEDDAAVGGSVIANEAALADGNALSAECASEPAASNFGSATVLPQAAASDASANDTADIAQKSARSIAHTAPQPAIQPTVAISQYPKDSAAATSSSAVEQPAADAAAVTIHVHKETPSRSSEAAEPNLPVSAVPTAAADIPAAAQDTPAQDTPAQAPSVVPESTDQTIAPLSCSKAEPAQATSELASMSAEAPVAVPPVAPAAASAAEQQKTVAVSKLPHASGSTRIGLPNQLSSLSKSLLGKAQQKAVSTHMRPVLSRGLSSAPRPDRGPRAAQPSTSEGSTGDALADANLLSGTACLFSRYICSAEMRLCQCPALSQSS